MSAGPGPPGARATLSRPRLYPRHPQHPPPPPPQPRLHRTVPASPPPMVLLLLLLLVSAAAGVAAGAEAEPAAGAGAGVWGGGCSTCAARRVRDVSAEETTVGATLGPGGTKRVKPLMNITVGYLTACRGNLQDRQCTLISGAMTLALKKVNDRDDILPWVHLNMLWNDTWSDTVRATRAITEMLCGGIYAFFGPEGNCDVESIVSQSWNIPMISYHCSDAKPSQVNTFARTEPPNTQVTKSILALLHYYDWKKFAVLWEESWSPVAETLLTQAKQSPNNNTITYKLSTPERMKCCTDSLVCCYENFWYDVIQESKNKTRIYVFLGSPGTLRHIMGKMNAIRLFDNGEYIVITADMIPYSEREVQKFLWGLNELSSECPKENVENRGRSLFVVVSTPPNLNYSNFTTEVSEYNQQPPFNFSTPPVLGMFKKFISIYAAYLYDAVWLYATALHRLLEPLANDLNTTVIETIARNGTLIIDTIKKMRRYDSITGASIRIDDNADSEGNFSVIALSNKAVTLNNFTCHVNLEPIGTFISEGDKLIYRMLLPPWWVKGDKPLDEPTCGFRNENCLDSHGRSVEVAATLGLLLFCATVVTLSIYRKWKIEQEIEGLLWKIDLNDLRGFFGNDIVSSPSKMSLASAASFESRCGPQLFAPTCMYRNVCVRIKELKFSKRKDIAREVMKEMRILRDLRHDNINSFIGACIEPMRVLLVSDYCAKGSLYDIVENEDLKLDMMFISSLVHDLIKGMMYIHKSSLGCHGNLKSSNCVVTSRWVLQVTDFGLHELRHCAENSGSIGEHQHYRSLFWKAPELLREDSGAPQRGTPKGDVYAFAIILYEIFGKRGPYGGSHLEPKEIIELVRCVPDPDMKPFRPDMSLLDLSDTPCEDFVRDCIQDCWSENPDNRPDFHTIRTALRAMKENGGVGRHRNIMDQMMEIMEKHAENLEALVSERTRQLADEKRKTVDLLNRMLPAPVADQLTKGYGVEPESFEMVTIYFSDIVGFTSMSAESSPLQVVNFLNDLYTLFDRIIKGYDVYKVETIGDAYMVVSGLPLRNGDCHAGEIASMSLELLDAVKNHHIAHRPNDILKLRIGIHTGPVVAGVVGLTMPRYCLFGDTVNTASRMESTGEPLRIHISSQCHAALQKIGGYIMEERGIVELKGKGEVHTYWLTGATECAIQKREVALEEMPPPLFCRPRRSPKLCAESRQASSLYAAITGLPGSRRHSSAPRAGTDSSPAASRSQRSGSSPEHALLRSCRLVDTSPLYIKAGGSVSNSRVTITVDGDGNSSQDLGDSDPDEDNPPQINNKRLTAMLAQSPLRETRSLDMFPKPANGTTSKPRRSSRSLETCLNQAHATSRPNSLLLTAGEGADAVNDSGISTTVPNGDVRPGLDGAGSSAEDVQAPLLLKQPSKRWKSLEEIAPNDTTSLPSNGYSKKTLPRGSIRSWLIGLFQGNGLRSGDTTTLRKGIHSGYSDLQAESESIV